MADYIIKYSLLDDGTQFKIYDRVIGSLEENINSEEGTMVKLMELIRKETNIALGENKSPIPIEREPEYMTKFPSEKCIFCNESTRHWYVPANTPICQECGAIYTVTDIPKRDKNDKALSSDLLIPIIQELSKLKHCYKIAIEGCILTVAERKGVTLVEGQLEELYKKAVEFLKNGDV